MTLDNPNGTIVPPGLLFAVYGHQTARRTIVAIGAISAAAGFLLLVRL